MTALIELRSAARRLLRQPGFSLPAIATLALGIGASAAVFTLLERVVLSPLPYPDAGRLVALRSSVPGINRDAPWGMAKGQYLYYRAQAHSFDDFALYSVSAATIAPRGSDERQRAERVHVAAVSASIAPALGARVVIGRPIAPAENLARDAQVALLSNDFWSRRFGGDASIVGSTIVIDGKPLQVVGVLAPDVRLPDELAAGGAVAVDAWTPMWIDPAQPAQNHHTFRGIARLKRGVTAQSARSELTALTARFATAMPSAYSARFMEKTRFAPEITMLRDDVLGGIARALWILFASVALVLAIAVANVANLFLVRHASRRRETAVRAALGAGRADLARHFLSESLPLALVAGGIGIALAQASIRALLVLSPGGIPRLGEVHLGWQGVAFALVVSAAVGALFGAMPLVRRGSEAPMLGDAGRGLTPSRRQHAVRSALIVAQVAVSLVLLASAALMLESFRHLRAVRPGLDPRGVLTFGVSLPESRYASFDAVAAFHRELATRIEALPGVEVAGMTTFLPLADGEGCSGISVEDHSLADADQPTCVPVIAVEPGFFSSLRIAVDGRTPDRADVDGHAAVAVMSGALARRIWPGQSAIGRGVRASDRGPFSRIVGVTADVRGDGLDKPPLEALFIPLYPESNLLSANGGPPREMTVTVRARTSEPEQLVPAIRRAVAAIDAQVPVTDVRSMDEVVARSTARTSFTTLLLVLASAMALVLSAVGMYGVIGYIVAQRRAEIGLRMALGAHARQVGGLVVLQSVRLAALGVAIGLAGALVTSRVLRSLLFQTSPTEPRTLAAVSLFLLVLAALASYLPARRAMRVDPVEALRS